MEIEILFDEAPQVFNIGTASCGVPPGVPAGLWEGRGAVRLDAFLPPGRAGIRLAREGITVTPTLAYMFSVLEPIMTHTPEITSLYKNRTGC